MARFKLQFIGVLLAIKMLFFGIFNALVTCWHLVFMEWTLGPHGFVFTLSLQLYSSSHRCSKEMQLPELHPYSNSLHCKKM